MEIKVDKKTFSTRKPSNLDTVLLDATGCDAAETARHLAGYPSAGRVAAALHPFLPGDAPSIAELAHAIPVGDVEFMAAVRGLYANVSEPAAIKPTDPAA